MSIEAILIKQIHSFRAAHNMYVELSMTGRITNYESTICNRRQTNYNPLMEEKHPPTHTQYSQHKCPKPQMYKTFSLARALYIPMHHNSKHEEAPQPICYSKFKTHELLSFPPKVPACPFTSTPTSSNTALSRNHPLNASSTVEHWELSHRISPNRTSH